MTDKSIDDVPLRTRLSTWIDSWLRRLLAGIGFVELRAILRGELATEKPNPRYRAHVQSMLLHIRPRYYMAASTRFPYTFRLGFLTAFLLFVEGISGLMLMLYYVPTPEGAYASILRLNSEIPYGEILRDVHRLAAEAMVITAVLHMLRTFLTASYKKERRLTWLTGVVLLFLTLFFAFTGYLLPWDQLAYWAVTIGTSMAAAIPWIGEMVNLLLRGGPEIGADGLLRFYQLHVILLPVLTVVLLSVHYYRVARIHSISLPASVEEGGISEEAWKTATRRIDLIPDLLIHEWFLIALGMLLLFAAVFIGYDAPLESPANPLRTPLETQAPWFFLWVQGLLKMGDKTLWGVVIPAALGLLLLVFPWLDRNPHRLARRRIPEIILAGAAVILLIILSYMGTAQYGIGLQPPVQLAQEFAPDERRGLVHQVAFDDLPVGVYEIGQPLDEAHQPGFTRLLEQVEGKMTEIFTGETIPQAWLVIEERQADLKQVTLRMRWQEADGQTKTQERVVYLHRQQLEAVP